MSDPRHRWEIEFVPEYTRDHAGKTVYCLATEAEARRYADQQHPAHLLSEIVFHRCGEVSAKAFIPLPT